jgi:hypothetical protein
MNMSCNRAFAQMSDSHTGPDPGYPWANHGAKHQGHPNFEDELDHGFGGQFTARQQHVVSGIVTLHELSHQVPGKRGGAITTLDVSVPRFRPMGPRTDEDTISLLRRLVPFIRMKSSPES